MSNGQSLHDFSAETRKNHDPYCIALAGVRRLLVNMFHFDNVQGPCLNGAVSSSNHHPPFHDGVDFLAEVQVYAESGEPVSDADPEKR
jgi:hypothetical protein